jgi:hypothetical protein
LTNRFRNICSYRGGVDMDGRPVMVVVGAHFLLRCLDLERFVLYIVKVTGTFRIVRQWIPLCFHLLFFLRVEIQD